MAITAPATSSTLAVADGKTFTVNKTLTLSGTDGTTETFPSTSASIARTDAAQQFTGDQTFTGSILGSSGKVVSWAGDAGISRSTAATLLIGNGTAGDSSGTLTGAEFTVSANANITGPSSGVMDVGTGTTPGTGGTLIANTLVAVTNLNMDTGGGTGHLLCSGTAPTISSGFGTSPSIVANNGTCAFQINVGTGGSATSGVIGLPTATTGWVCSVEDITTESTTVFRTKQTASSTTSATVGNFNTSAAAAAWVASDKLMVSCKGF
jgi:hypothetical protein